MFGDGSATVHGDVSATLIGMLVFLSWTFRRLHVSAFIARPCQMVTRTLGGFMVAATTEPPPSHEPPVFVGRAGSCWWPALHRR